MSLKRLRCFSRIFRQFHWLLIWGLLGCRGAMAATNTTNDSGLDLVSELGHVVYVDFWASWCGPCRQSFPWMNQMQQRYGGQGLVILAVNVDEQHEDALNFLQQHPAGFRVIYDPKGLLASHYAIPGMPTTLVFDRKGHLVEQRSGFRIADESHYEQALQAILTRP